jgi:maltose-binding protein MalE
MLKAITHAVALALLIALAAAAALPSEAAEGRAASTESVEKDKKTVRVPFRGKLAAVDKAAKTLSLEGKEKKRVIHITSETKIMKSGVAATLDDAVIGEEIGGLVVRKGDGREEAVSIRLGEKPNTKPARSQ